MKKINILTAALVISLSLNPDVRGTTSIDVSSWLFPISVEKASILGQSSHPADDNEVRIVNGINTMEIKYDGDIKVGNDDRSIRSISPGGYLTFSVRTFGNKRELTITSDKSGQLSYAYYEGRTEIPFEPEGREWMEDVLIDVIRASGIDAEGRTNRIYSDSGLNGFIDEIKEIRSNSVKRRYFSALLSGHNLPNQELKAIAESITRTMSSDSERSRLFREYADLFLKDNEVAVSYFSAFSRLSSNSERGRIYRNIDEALDFSDPMLVDAYFQGIDRISSNSEKGNVLRHTLGTKEMTDRAYVSIFNTVAKLSSSSEAGRVIRTTDKLNLNNKELTAACFAAINRISSNSEKSSALRHLISRNALEEQAMVSFLNSCMSISSSSEKSRVLMSIADIDLAGNQMIREQYFNAINSISSESESGRVLRYTLEKHDMDNNSMQELLESAEGLSSSTEKSRVLRTITGLDLVGERELSGQYFNTVNSISSDSESGRTLRYTLEKHELDRNSMRALFESAAKLSSSSERSNVLRTAIPYMIYDQTVLDAYFKAVTTTSSSSEQGRILRDLINRGKLDSRVITGVLNSARTISSSTEKGSVLRAVAPKIPENDSTLRDLYMETAKTIGSDSEYRRTIDALM
jgi:hypothetical protein